jgi:hypothetical protein
MDSKKVFLLPEKPVYRFSLLQKIFLSFLFSFSTLTFGLAPDSSNVVPVSPVLRVSPRLHYK